MKNFFDFSDTGLQEAYIEESLVAEVQHDIAKLMKAKGVSRADLARRLKVSAPYVTQMLGDDDANLTLRTVARIYSALGEKATIAAEVARPKQSCRPRLSSHASAGQGWSGFGPSDPWARDEELAKSADRTDGCVVIWLDAVPRKAA